MAYIAALLEREDIVVSILDANVLNLALDDLRTVIARENPDIIGISTVTMLVKDTLTIARLAKEFNEHIKVVVGGIHPTVYPEEFLRDKNVDFVVRGEGEFTFLDLVKTIEEKKTTFNTIRGVVYRKESSIRYSPARDYISNLDLLPFPARHLLPLDKYWAPSQRYPFGTILTSRGCNYQCIFCSTRCIHGQNVRMRSWENVIAEIESLVREYGVKELFIEDDTFTENPKRVMKICDEMISRGIDLTWKCPNGVRANNLSFDLLKSMRKAGCYQLGLGIESGDEDILRNIKKGITLDMVRNVVKKCNQVGIGVVGFFMFGNLGETKDSMQKTIDFAKELNLDDAIFHMTVPLPGTEYFKFIEENGKFLTKQWSKFTPYGEPVFELGDVKSELMKNMLKKSYRDFYFRPKVFLKRFSKIRSLNELNAILHAGINLIT